MFFNQYPYLNLNDLNLDYILKAIGEMKYEVTNFVSINAIKYADPIQWNITSQYEKNTIVIDPVTGTAYISVAPVPAGVALTRPEYWTVVFDLGSFVTRAAQNFTSRWESETTATATFPTNTGEWLVWGDVLYKALTNITAGDTYVVNGNIDHFTIEDLYNAYLNTVASILGMIGDLVDLNTVDKTNLVAAINEVVADLAAVREDVENLKRYSVLDYGAKGDGISDDTQAIIDCITANDGAYFPRGTYIISGTIFLNTNQYLLGEDNNSAIIKMANGANIDMIKSVGFDSLVGTDNHDNAQHNIGIYNLTIDGNYKSNPENISDTGVVNNTLGTGISIYAGGIKLRNVTVYNCADDGIHTEWNSYLNNVLLLTGGEAVFDNVVSKCNGRHGWEFNGPHDSIITNCIIGTNNRKNVGCHNMYVGAKGNFKMTNCHMYSDYGLPKVASSMYMDVGSLPCVISNCDIEGGLNADLVLITSEHIFSNCRFYASFGASDIYIANATSKHNQFINCYAEKQYTETGITPPTWHGAIEFAAADSVESYFDFFVKDTPLCIYAEVSPKCIWHVIGYNDTTAVGGKMDALPDIMTLSEWHNEFISIRGDFETQSEFDYNLNSYEAISEYAGKTRYNFNDGTIEAFSGSTWFVPQLTVKYEGQLKYFDGSSWVVIPAAAGNTQYDFDDGMIKAFNGSVWFIPENTARYNTTNLCFEFWNGSSWIIPTGTTRYNTGSSQLEYYNGSSWVTLS